MKSQMSKLVRSIRGLPEAKEAPTGPSHDAPELARQLSAVFIEQLNEYRRARNADLNLIEIDQLKDQGLLRAILEKSPNQVTFVELEYLSRDRPEAAIERWEEIKKVARSDMSSGGHAARSVSHDAWDRACFLSIRDMYQQVWPPRNAVETMIIDEIAQYEFVRRSLIGRFGSGSWSGDAKLGKQYAATAEMGRTIERLQRLVHYSVRVLVGLRRAPLSVSGQAVVSLPAGEFIGPEA